MKSAPLILLFFTWGSHAYTTPSTKLAAQSNSLVGLRPDHTISKKETFSTSEALLFLTHKKKVTTKICVSTNSDVDTSSTSSTKEEEDIMKRKKRERAERIKKLGGPLAFSTAAGALNPFGIFYGLTAIGLGIIWWLELTACRLLYFISRNRIDSMRCLPVFFSHVWGSLVLKLTRGTPECINREILDEFYKTKRAAMFVANHNSWQDIPYLGLAIGWRNYKIVAKQELTKVPILSSAITVGGNVVVDRTNRRSQLMTLKKGIEWLKSGVHLCTFPEGTRSKTGRLNKFKNGAFKMSHKAGAPVIPISIVAAGKIQPVDFMFPIKPSKGVAKVVIHEPIESVGKTEDELAEEVRLAILSGLPEDQRPLE